MMVTIYAIHNIQLFCLSFEWMIYGCCCAMIAILMVAIEWFPTIVVILTVSSVTMTIQI